jgi:hypothetical protein
MGRTIDAVRRHAVEPLKGWLSLRLGLKFTTVPFNFADVVADIFADIVAEIVADGDLNSTVKSLYSIVNPGERVAMTVSRSTYAFNLRMHQLHLAHASRSQGVSNSCHEDAIGPPIPTSVVDPAQSVARPWTPNRRRGRKR